MTEDNLYQFNIDKRGVGYLGLNRPEIHNAFNDDMILSLTTLIEGLYEDSSLKVLVLYGEGKSFCAGADLNWMKKMKSYSEKENMEDSNKLDKLFKVLYDFPKPIIGKIHGAALGGGSGLVAICDYALASAKTTFGFTEVKLGLIPAVISPYVMAKIGFSYARSLFLNGMRFNAQRALEIGLIHEIADPASLDESVEKIVKEFLSAGPTASAFAKTLITEVMRLGGRPSIAASSFTTEFIAKVRIANEGQEGMTALLEKRKPEWVSKNEN